MRTKFDAEGARSAARDGSFLRKQKEPSASERRDGADWRKPTKPRVQSHPLRIFEKNRKTKVLRFFYFQRGEMRTLEFDHKSFTK